MKPSDTHAGWPFAVITAAAFGAIERGYNPHRQDERPKIFWDQDERTSRGDRRRPVMHIAGLQITPDDFQPGGKVEGYFHEAGAAHAYPADDWHLTAAAELLAGIEQLDLNERVLIAVWCRQSSHVGVLSADEAIVDLSDLAAFVGVRWSPADPGARPRVIREHPSGCGVSLVLLDTLPPSDPAEGHNSTGLPGLRDALNDLIFVCDADVMVREHAADAEPELGGYIPVHGLAKRLERFSEATGEVHIPRVSGVGAGPLVWFLLRDGPRFPPIGHVLRIRPRHLVSTVAPAGEETWELMRDYGIEAGFDRVVIADYDYSDGRERRERATIFREHLPQELAGHNQRMVAAVRSVGPQALDARLQDLHAVWDALANWEGPVRGDADAAEFIRAYSASGGEWPTRQSKSSPSIIWIGEDEGNRPGGYLQGLAGAFHPERDLLEINADFPAFRALQAYWAEQYVHGGRASTPSEMTVREITDTIAEVVREWCEQTLVEAVVGVNQLAGRPGWDEARVRAALSPEALSGAALAIHHVQQSIKRSLGQRLGSLKETKVM